MNITAKLSAYALSLLLAVACTDEDGRANQALPDNGDGQRREVLLTLKNKLAIPQAGTKAGTTKADTPIASAEENFIRSLDVYVFASETEGGDYTFQELFYFRDNATTVPGDWAHEIDLTGTPGTDNTTTLLKLTKGLFVKIYCVANREQLYATAADGTVSAYANFQPLHQSAPGQDNNTVTPGVPTEADFLKLHTKPINPAVVNPTEDDILVTPLPMAGSYTTPLDLTDFGVSARTQVGFKMTRAVSRFDIQNDAAKSKFTIGSISMAKARPGATFFPIRTLGTLPTAVDGELVVTPARAFTGANANKGLEQGAFYSYPSPTDDEGYLILKGTYAVNETESQEVSYRIPFKSANDTEGASLEISHNHRYTIAITDADTYHLDFTLTVADWADDGSIDDYAPGEGTGTATTVDVSVDPNNKTVYDEATRTVTMPIITNTQFDLTAGTGYSLTKTYTGGPSAQQYDWLEVSAPVDVTKTVVGQKYTFSLKSGYTGEKYPEATIELKKENSGDSQLFKVRPEYSAPIITTGTTYTLAAKADSEVPYIDIRLDCIGGSAISGPDWLTYDKVSSDMTATTYRISLNPHKQGITFPEELPADQTLTLANKKSGQLTSNVTVSFTDALRMETDLAGHDAKETDDNSYRVTTAGKTLSIVTYSMFKMPDVSIATDYDSNYGIGNNWLPAPTNPSKTDVVNNRRKYTYQIVIPASTGMDKDYQLHKGTIIVKDGSTNIKSYTIWRGASNKPYPTGGGSESGSPYYSAIKKGGYWWAPINCGAKHVAQNGQADIQGLGNLYQWGRKDAANFGSLLGSAPTSNSNPNDNKFYHSLAGATDWLSPTNNSLWQNGLNDPCPSGYHVPKLEALATWDSGNYTNGIFIITPDAGFPALVLPCVGYKDINAYERNQGQYGDYWSSTANGPESGNVTIGKSTNKVIVTDKKIRILGFSVRCVRNY